MESFSIDYSSLLDVVSLLYSNITIFLTAISIYTNTEPNVTLNGWDFLPALFFIATSPFALVTIVLQRVWAAVVLLIAHVASFALFLAVAVDGTVFELHWSVCASLCVLSFAAIILLGLFIIDYRRTFARPQRSQLAAYRGLAGLGAASIIPFALASAPFRTVTAEPLGWEAIVLFLATFVSGIVSFVVVYGIDRFRSNVRSLVVLTMWSCFISLATILLLVYFSPSLKGTYRAWFFIPTIFAAPGAVAGRAATVAILPPELQHTGAALSAAVTTLVFIFSATQYNLPATAAGLPNDIVGYGLATAVGGFMLIYSGFFAFKHVRSTRERPLLGGGAAGRMLWAGGRAPAWSFIIVCAAAGLAVGIADEPNAGGEAGFGPFGSVLGMLLVLSGTRRALTAAAAVGALLVGVGAAVSQSVVIEAGVCGAGAALEVVLMSHCRLLTPGMSGVAAGLFMMLRFSFRAIVFEDILKLIARAFSAVLLVFVAVMGFLGLEIEVEAANLIGNAIAI